jgi:dolichol-phosphate mannosyltransferase
VTYRALRAGARVREVPILFRDRQIGDSKMSSRIVVEALWKTLQLRLRPIATA